LLKVMYPMYVWTLLKTWSYWSVGLYVEPDLWFLARHSNCVWQRRNGWMCWNCPQSGIWKRYAETQWFSRLLNRLIPHID
jgi:hypothetical protein